MSHHVHQSARSMLVRAGIALALGAGVLAVTPAADAASVASVRTHVHRADRALSHLVAGASSAGSTSGSLAQLLGQVHAADRAAASIYTHAHNSSAKADVAKALEMIANQQGRDVTALTPLLSLVPGADQTSVANAIASLTQGREMALSVLAQLLGSLPSSAQGPLASAVATASGTGAGQVGRLSNVLPTSIVCAAADAFGQIVTTAAAAVQTDVTRIQSLLSMLPSDLQAKFTQLVSSLPGELTSLLSKFQQALNCPQGRSTGSTPGTGSGSSTGAGSSTTPPVGSLFGLIKQFIGSIVQSFLPAVQSGQSSPGAALPGPLGGLLGGLTKGVPGFGNLPGLGSLFGGSGHGLLGG